MIGLGYYGTHTPAVIRRNVLENPAWYTAYTPYQPEISQGRLEALLTFQTLVEDLTALPVAGASLLDEATAAAEAMTLARRAARRGRIFLADADCLPQTLAVLATRAEPLGIELVVGPVTPELIAAQPEGELFGVLLQYPGASGEVRDLRPVIDAAHGQRRARRRGRRPAGPDPADAARASWAPTSRWAARSGSACRWATAARTRPTSSSATSCAGSCPAAWSACPWTRTAGRPTGSRCRPASSTSAGRRRPATSAPRRCCWP